MMAVQRDDEPNSFACVCKLSVDQMSTGFPCPVFLMTSGAT